MVAQLHALFSEGVYKPLDGVERIDGHHLGPEKVAVIRVAANQGFLKHCGEWRCVLDPRYQGWSLRGVPLYLSMFEYTLKFRGTKEHATVNCTPVENNGKHGIFMDFDLSKAGEYEIMATAEQTRI